MAGVSLERFGRGRGTAGEVVGFVGDGMELLPGFDIVVFVYLLLKKR